jgi:hypothetical protein
LLGLLSLFFGGRATSECKRDERKSNDLFHG